MERPSGDPPPAASGAAFPAHVPRAWKTALAPGTDTMAAATSPPVQLSAVAIFKPLLCKKSTKVSSKDTSASA